jgi:hypothetical protein
MSVRALLTSQSVVGVLGRDLSVRLLEISRAGCLLESSSQLPVGTLGDLAVEVDGEEYVDQVRIARCQAIAGAGNTHRLGAEFLTLHMPGARSLRRYAVELAADLSAIEPPRLVDRGGALES